MDRTRRLLAVGHFPTQLPPGFHTGDFSDHYQSFLTGWRGLKDPNIQGRQNIQTPKKAPTSKIETFSVARAGHRRRMTGITNPVAQLYLSEYISQHWGSLLKHYRKSKLSASRPRIRHDSPRGVTIPSMKLHSETLLHRSAGYKYVLRTDISRFFPTIYTHSIPWALHSKSVSKTERSRARLYGNLLDETCRQLQDGQTIGLPIGPDTSHIIAEAIASAVDVQLFDQFTGLSGFRFVDDYYLFFHTRQEAESCLASLAQALSQYELQINFEKTRICETVELSDDLWSHQLRAFSISNRSKAQARDLHHLFELAKRLARENTDESVMLYALKRASSIVVRPENWATFVAHLCHVAIAYPNTLQQIETMISTYVDIGYPIKKEPLGRLVNSIIKEHAPLSHHSEVAWCLWMCKKNELMLDHENVVPVTKMKSSVCSLILLDMEKCGLLPCSVDYTVWDLLRDRSSLWGEQWLLCYEAGVRGWANFSPDTVAADQHFKLLADLAVRFYNSDASSTPMFTFDLDAILRAKGEIPEDLLKLLEEDEAEEYVTFKQDHGAYQSTAFLDFASLLEALVDESPPDESAGDD